MGANLLVDHFDPRRCALWVCSEASRHVPARPLQSVPLRVALADEVCMGLGVAGVVSQQEVPELARIVVSKPPAQPPEAFAAQSQVTVALLVRFLGTELAERFACTADLGGTVVLVQTRHGWFHAFPQATQLQDQGLQLCSTELAADVQE